MLNAFSQSSASPALRYIQDKITADIQNGRMLYATQKSVGFRITFEFASYPEAIKRILVLSHDFVKKDQLSS